MNNLISSACTVRVHLQVSVHVHPDTQETTVKKPVPLEPMALAAYHHALASTGASVTQRRVTVRFKHINTRFISRSARKQ